MKFFKIWKNAPGEGSLFSKFSGFGLEKTDSMISVFPVNLPIVSEQLFYIAPPPGECFRIETCSSLNFRAICFLEWWWVATFEDRMCVCLCVCVCMYCVCVCVFTSVHREGFACLELELQETDQQCFVEDVSFLCQVLSSLL